MKTIKNESRNLYCALVGHFISVLPSIGVFSGSVVQSFEIGHCGFCALISRLHSVHQFVIIFNVSCLSDRALSIVSTKR